MAMDQQLPLAVVCRVPGAPGSTVYARRGRATGTPRPGLTGSISDNDLPELIRTASGRGGSAGTTKRSSNLPMWASGSCTGSSCPCPVAHQDDAHARKD
jgi:hypothetical protein